MNHEAFGKILLTMLVFSVFALYASAEAYDSSCSVQISGNGANCSSGSGTTCNLKASTSGYTATVAASNSGTSAWTPICVNSQADCSKEFSLKTWTPTRGSIAGFLTSTAFKPPLSSDPNRKSISFNSSSAISPNQTASATFQFGTNTPTTAPFSWNFQTTGNGTQVTIYKKVAIILAFDVSSSMEFAITPEKASAKTFLDYLKDQFGTRAATDLRIGIVRFRGSKDGDDRVKLLRHLALVSSSRWNDLKSSIDDLDTAGTTPTAEGLFESMTEFDDYATQIPADWEKYVILFTDGNPKCIPFEGSGQNANPCADSDYQCHYCGGSVVDRAKNYTQDIAGRIKGQGIKIFTIGIQSVNAEPSDSLDCDFLNTSVSSGTDYQFCNTYSDTTQVQEKIQDALTIFSNLLNTVNDFGNPCSINLNVLDYTPTSCTISPQSSFTNRIATTLAAPPLPFGITCKASAGTLTVPCPTMTWSGDSSSTFTNQTLTGVNYKPTTTGNKDILATKQGGGFSCPAYVIVNSTPIVPDRCVITPQPNFTLNSRETQDLQLQCFNHANTSNLVDCPAGMAWSITEAGGGLLNNQTSTGAIYGAPSVSTAQTYHINASGSGISNCQTSATVNPAPAQSCTLSHPHSADGIFDNETEVVTAACKDSVGTIVNCPELNWTAGGGGSFLPNPTVPPQTSSTYTPQALSPGWKLLRAAETSNLFWCDSPLLVKQALDSTCSIQVKDGATPVTSLVSGKEYALEITVNNIGKQTWDALWSGSGNRANKYLIGAGTGWENSAEQGQQFLDDFENPEFNKWLTGKTRYPIGYPGSSNPVLSGQSRTTSFKITPKAVTSITNATLAFRTLQENVTWFGIACTLPIQIRPVATGNRVEIKDVILTQNGTGIPIVSNIANIKKLDLGMRLTVKNFGTAINNAKIKTKISANPEKQTPELTIPANSETAIPTSGAMNVAAAADLVEGKTYTLQISLESSDKILDSKTVQLVVGKAPAAVPETSPLLVVLALGIVLGIIGFKKKRHK